MPALPDQALLGARASGGSSEADYAELVEDAKAFLAGKSTGVQARLGKQMAEAAEAQDFELAAVYRDRLRALTYIQGSQTVHAEGLGDADIFALACKAGADVASRPSSSAAGRIGATAPSSRRTPTTCPRTRCCRASSSSSTRTCRRRERILRRPRAARRASCSRRRCASAPATRSRSTSRSAAPRRKLIEQARRNAEEALDRRLAETTHPGQGAARAGRHVRAARRAQAHRGLRQQPHHGHQRDRRDDRRRARGLPQEQLPQVQHQAAAITPGDDFGDDARGAGAALRPAREGGPRPGRAANGPTCC